MPPESHDAPTPQEPAVTRWIGRAKKHPVVVTVTAVVAVVTFVSSAFGLVSSGVEWVRDKAEPDRDTLAAVEQLELDMSVPRTQELLGTATTDGPLCDDASCAPETQGLRLLTFDRTSVTVTAVFDGSALVLYGVTLVDPDTEPPIRWFGGVAGTLGQQTYEEAMVVGETAVSPTSLSFRSGNRDSSYVEVAALGAPGDYQGLLLGSVRFGAPTTWDVQAAETMRSAGGVEVPLEAAEGFRASSVPNTFGVFRDDAAGRVFEDADEVANALLGRR